MRWLCLLTAVFVSGLALGHAGDGDNALSFSASSSAPGPFTVVVMPDTQKYVEFYPRGIANQIEWICQNRDVLNCKFVVHEGDIVQNPGKAEEWEIADAAFKKLDGVVPYCFSIGNHDMDVGKRDKTLYRKVFPRERFAAMPTFGGSQNEHADNTYHLFEVGDLKFMVITLEYDPKDPVLNWANDVVAQHPDRRVIVDTHSYLNVNERNDQGKVIWDKFVRKHANIFLVVCGHLSVGRRAARGDHGNLVHELLGNYQDHENGGNGWLRLLRFHPSENRIEVRTYSTLLNRYMRESDPRWSRLSDNHFDLPYLMREPEPEEPLAFQKVRETAAPRGLYHEMDIEGWTVLVHPELEEGDPDLWERTRDLLGEKLRAMVGVLPARAIQELREVPIWVEHEHPMHPCMCYHPEAGWLRENAMNPDKAGAVEIANARNFIEWSETQPWMVLHEMAHAYHFRRLGAEHPEIRQAYEEAVAAKRYEAVAHVDGRTQQRHYALTNDKEYFAEATEAYYGKNDFAPFDREALAEHDPRIFQILPRLWGEAPLEARLIESKKIWDAAKHNAFTDLVAWRGQLYCAFREGEKHADDHGQLRVLVSSDGGATWKPAAVLRQSGVDLRDAKLAVTPDDRLMLLGGRQTGTGDKRFTSTIVSYSADGRSWSLPEPVGDEGRWLWGVVWEKERAYGVAYPSPNGVPHTSLMTSTDGRRFETLVAEFASEERPTEAVVRFDAEGRPRCLHRRDGDPGKALWGSAEKPEGPWTWQTLDRKIGGPGLIQIPGGHWIAVVRLYDVEERTEVCLVDPDNARLIPLLRLPSGGDTSYPGLVWQNDQLLVSYYASHDDKTSIYFAKVAFEEHAIRAD